MTFFFDNNLSWRLAKALCYLEEDENKVMHLTEVFSANTQDEVWLEDVGKKGMLLVSKDIRIRKHKAALLALKQHNVGAFFLIGRKLTKWQEIRQLIFQWEKMKELAQTSHRPFAFLVPQRGNITSIALR
jgi:hypothetical protein